MVIASINQASTGGVPHQVVSRDGGASLTGEVGKGPPPQLQQVRAGPEQEERERPEGESRSEQELRDLIEDLNRSAQVTRSRLRFNYNQDIGRQVVAIIDGSTQEVIKEVPPEDFVKFSIKFREFIGALIDVKT